MVTDTAVQSAPPPTILSVRDLEIGYGSDIALSGVNLEINQNEIFGIIGPANAGKTSLAPRALRTAFAL